METGKINLKTSYINLEINGMGILSSLKSNSANVEYLPKGQVAPFLSIRCQGEFEAPAEMTVCEDSFTLLYAKNQVEICIKAQEYSSHISFEIIEVSNHEKLELILWGPYPNTIGEVIGETVGVVRNSEFALGIQSLNMKTLGGYPHYEDDEAPDSEHDWKEIISWEDLPGTEIESLDRQRGDTAWKEEFGSVLQAYCRNRNKDRIIHNKYIQNEHCLATAYNDGGVKGSKIALFGCPEKDVLDTIGKIEQIEGLPHPVIDGEWLKTSPRANESYFWIKNLHYYSFEDSLELTKKAGLKHLYLADPFEEWGHFVLDRQIFPENWKTLKEWVDTAKQHGIEMGVHTLSNFITPNDAFVTPVPDRRLVKEGFSTLTEDINADSDEIQIESADFFANIEKSTFRAAVIDNEIISYEEISQEAPYILKGCLRGAFGTQASTHKKGDTIGKLVDHGYWVFLGDADLNDEIAKILADLCNQTGVTRFAFDGIEGTAASGLGAYGLNRIVNVWYKHLKPELQGGIFWESSIPTHFNWHAETCQNWGEPWYGEFRESQMPFRLRNVKYYSRNYLPRMLGNFKFIHDTSLEDAEWLGAKAAGLEAGFALVALDQDVQGWTSIRENAIADKLLSAIKTWETARMADAFSSDQKKLLLKMDHEFHLEEMEEGTWSLYPYKIGRTVIERTTIKPASGAFDFDNPYEDQPMMLSIKMVPNRCWPYIRRLKLKVNDNKLIEIPVYMSPHQTLTWDSENGLRLYARNWKLLKQIEFDESLPMLVNGLNHIEIEAGMTRTSSAPIRIQVKSAGKPQRVISSKA